MTEQNHVSGPPERTPMTGVLFVVGMVFVVNLTILAYSVTRSVSTHEGETGSNHSTTVSSTQQQQQARTGTAQPPPAGQGTQIPSAATLQTAPVITTNLPVAQPDALVVNPITLPESPVTQGLYLQHCAACHGLTGRGDGPAANQLYPRPRDFVDSPFRFAPRGGGHEALIEAIQRSISLGVPRSSMPGFQGVLPEAEIAGLARYVASMRSDQQIRAGMEQEIEVGTRPPTTPGLISRGASLYTSLGCIACHGETGRGDGPSSRGLVDSLGRPVRPADLTSGLFKGAQSPEDLVRTILKGIPGTPMTPFEAVLTAKNPDGTRNLTDAWAVVAFISSLKGKSHQIGEPSGGQIAVTDALDPEMLLDPNNLAWLGIEPVEIELKPIWQREESITHLVLRSVRSSKSLSICLEWRDASMDIRKDQNTFPDGVAIMFSLGKEVPALPMGVRVEGHKPEAPVNIWHWQADRQFTASMIGKSNTVLPFRPSSRGWELFLLPPEAFAAAPVPPAAAPEYPTLPSFLTACEAGSVQSQDAIKPHAVLESNAEGFGTLTPQPVQHQDVWAAAAWSNGVWRVLLVRDLESHQDMDIPLSKETKIPVSFAVWDGSRLDRNGTKLISGWHWLLIPKLTANQSRSAQAEITRQGR